MGMRISSLAVLGAALLCGAPAGAQQAPAASRAAFNDECRDVWSRLSPAFMARLQADAAAQLAAVNQVSPSTEVRVTRVRGVQVDLAAPFGFSQLGNDCLEMALPLPGKVTGERN